MNVSDVVVVLAVLIAPVLAVQVQKWLDEFREKRRYKQFVFATLMRTRAARVSADHIQALNAIELVYYGKSKKNQQVLNAWRKYFDHLNPSQNDEGAEESIKAARVVSWQQESDRLFISLLGKMASALGYRYDEVTLKRSFYSPRAEGEREEDLFKLRRFLARLTTWEAAFPVVAFPPPQPQQQAGPRPAASPSPAERDEARGDAEEEG